MSPTVGLCCLILKDYSVRHSFDLERWTRSRARAPQGEAWPLAFGPTPLWRSRAGVELEHFEKQSGVWPHKGSLL